MHNKDYILNIGPGGISLIAVNNVTTNLILFHTFEIKLNIKKTQEDFRAFYNHLMQRLSDEIIYKVVGGQIYNGDLLRLFPIVKDDKFQIKVNVYRQSYKLDYDIEKYTKMIPDILEIKKEEIKKLRNKLNQALDSKDFNLCDNIIQKINYIKDEFMI